MFYQLARNYLVRRCCSLHEVPCALFLDPGRQRQRFKEATAIRCCGFWYLHDFLSHLRTRTKFSLTHNLALALYGNIIPDARESLRPSFALAPSC
jgi:hypothetical protein